MRVTDGLLILAIFIVVAVGYMGSKFIGVKRSAFVRTANRKNSKALKILEEAGYHYVGGAKKKSVIQSINQQQYERDVSYDLLVRQGFKRYLVLIAKSEKEKLHTVDAREKLMLISESFPSDGILYVTVSSGRILPIGHRWSRHKDYRMFGRERCSRLLIFMAGIVVTFLWLKARGI